MKHLRRAQIDLPRPAPADIAPPLPACLTVAELEAIGRHLYGDWWKSPLARALNISRSTMHRIADGTARIDGPIISCLWFIQGYHPLQTGATPPIKYIPHKYVPRRRPSGKIRNPEKFIVE